MKKYMRLFLMAMVGSFVVLVACRPPEIEGLIVRINQQMYDDETYDLAEEAVQQHPQNAEAWYYYGWLHSRKGEFNKMNEAFDKVLELNPSQIVKLEGISLPANEAIERVRLNHFAENFNSAKANYDKALEAPDEEQRKQLLRTAADKFELAHQADPSRIEPFHPLAVALLLLGDTLEAEKRFEQAVELDPQNDQLIVSLADFYAQINNVDKARENYQKALTLNENSQGAYLGLGQIETTAGNWDKAAEYFEKALEMDPNNTTVAFNIGVSYYNQEKYAEAIPYLKRTLDVESDNSQLYEILGICYVQSKMYDEGMEFLEGAVERFPDNADLWNYLAIIYANQGMKEKAEAAMEKTKELEEM